MSGPAVDHPLVVLGPTASGKSAVGMAIAGRDRSVEIVAVDSMQVYRGMDIGTAKPTAADRHAVRHHCLDLVDPADEFTVADFVRAATGALADIHAISIEHPFPTGLTLPSPRRKARPPCSLPSVNSSSLSMA
mgnify:CR=1 FL=1